METKKSQQRFTGEFKAEAVRQVTERGHPVAEVAARLGVSSHSQYAWIKRYGVPPAQRAQQDSQCIDPPNPAQVTLLKRMPQPAFSYPAPDGAAGGCRTGSSRQ